MALGPTYLAKLGYQYLRPTTLKMLLLMHLSCVISLEASACSLKWVLPFGSSAILTNYRQVTS